MLRARIKASSITVVARELGYSRAAVSLVHSGKYIASSSHLGETVLKTYCQYQCPHLQREISFLECRGIRTQPFSASSPLQARQWRACQACDRNPERTQS